MGSLTIICGSMFSGKTTELLRRFRRANLQNKLCYIICSTLVNDVETHDNFKISGCIKVTKIKEFEKYSMNQSEHKFDLFIDEGHFYEQILQTNLSIILQNYYVMLMK
jgi:thymidine kinase